MWNEWPWTTEKDSRWWRLSKSMLGGFHPWVNRNIVDIPKIDRETTQILGGNGQKKTPPEGGVQPQEEA
jgi:hypothetical protein